MSLIRTLSVPAYIARLNQNGYSAAICLPDGPDPLAPVRVLEQFSAGTNYGFDRARVAVASGRISSPAHLRGCYLMQQASDVREHCYPGTDRALFQVLSPAEGRAALPQVR